MRWRSAFTLLALIACKDKGPADPDPPVAPSARAFRMGFSNLPPAPDLMRGARAVLAWLPRADAAIIHAEPQWAALLAGELPANVAKREFEGLVAAYRGRNIPIVLVIDVTNGIDRKTESAPLVSAGRSITEPAVQALYREWVRTLVAQIQPVALGLAAETNLIRLAAPSRLYNAVVQMTNDAAREVRAASPALPLFITVQVETAWGRLQGTNQYIGVEQDFRDFPFSEWLGLSSYPYLANFSEPEQVPDNWYSRVLNGRTIPTVITEGGWTSGTAGTIVSTPGKQARWITRQMQLADSLRPRFVFQLAFTDLDLVAYNRPNDPQLVPFAQLGLVDATLLPKLALAQWDATFARPLAR